MAVSSVPHNKAMGSLNKYLIPRNKTYRAPTGAPGSLMAMASQVTLGQSGGLVANMAQEDRRAQLDSSQGLASRQVQNGFAKKSGASAASLFGGFQR